MTAIPSRRSVLGAAAVGTAALAATTVVAPTASAARSTDSGGGSRLVSQDKVVRLLRRATYGTTATSLATARSQGRTAWLEAQLAPSTISDTSVDAMLKHFPRLGWTIQQVWDAESRTDHLQLDNYGWEVMQDLLNATIGRALWSKRQLLEVMVEFWSNHLNVTCPNGDVWDSRHLYDKGVIRKYALGTFSSMLYASARHPAMLVYLNQAESSKEAPNENYARELLELHSVGVDGGYDEEDIYAAAALLTGLTLRNPDPRTPSWTRRSYAFDPTMHDTRAGSVMGFSWKAHAAADGIKVIERYVTYLARHRQTAERIATKLCQRFVADEAPAGLVTKLADVYQANDTAIVPVLRALFTSTAFYDTTQIKVRRPYEDIIAGLRAIGVRPSSNADFPASGASYFDGLQAVYWQLRDLGHAPLNWGQPNGYPDTAKDWQSANGMLGRWNLHRNHANGWWPSSDEKAFVWPKKPSVPNWNPDDLPLCRALVPVALPATYGGLVDVLSDRLLNMRMIAEHREAVAAYFGKTSASALKDTDPAVRWQFGDLVSLVLDSPYHALR